jgi:hypothetical protein
MLTDGIDILSIQNPCGIKKSGIPDSIEENVAFASFKTWGENKYY